MRVAAIGRTRILWNSIRRLHDEGHQITIIITCKASPEYDIREDDFKELANDLQVEFILTNNINQPTITDALRKTQSEIAISVNWINIIGPEACNAFRYGILNAHAGDLPRYRGNAPIAWAILQGESEIGLTIHQMDPFELDAGPIYVKDYFPLTNNTYIGDVMRWVEERTHDLFLMAVNGIGKGTLQPTAQTLDPLLMLRCYPRLPEDGKINWDQPVEHLDRLVRASAEPFTGAFSFWNSDRLTIWRGRQGKLPSPSLAVPGQVLWRDDANGEVGIAAQDGVLILEEIELPSRGRIKPATAIKSLRGRLKDST